MYQKNEGEVLSLPVKGEGLFRWTTKSNVSHAYQICEKIIIKKEGVTPEGDIISGIIQNRFPLHLYKTLNAPSIPALLMRVTPGSQFAAPL